LGGDGLELDERGIELRLALFLCFIWRGVSGDAFVPLFPLFSIISIRLLLLLLFGAELAGCLLLNVDMGALFEAKVLA
jgi:hypothetical protein